MCGFTGFMVAAPNIPTHFSRTDFAARARLLSHRGNTESRTLEMPNYWITHHRLAFQDVALGAQPMFDRTGEWFIVFNGEVYNHLELRNTVPELSGLTFKTRSDTETLLEGFLASGENFLDQLDGEYAFVIVKKDASQIYAHRDPSGVKPLFFSFAAVNTAEFAHCKETYTFLSPEVAFASEIKGLIGAKKWSRDGLLRQFTGLFEPIRTPFENIIQILPGALLSCSRAADRQSYRCHLKSRVRALRNPDLLAQRGARNVHFSALPVREFMSCLESSVADRTLSDVELGVYLSGGVDSRTVASFLARKQSGAFGRQAFTVGFEQAGYDETKDALEFAAVSGFKSHVLTMTQDTLRYAYPLAVQASENLQPYTNGAAKWWLSLMTRKHVQGVLTGDGADELLCGYPSYRYVKWWMHIMRSRNNDLGNLRAKPLGQLPRDSLYARVFAAQGNDPWLSGASSFGSGLDFVDSLALWGVAHPLFGQIHSIAELVLGKDCQSWLESQAESIRSWFAAGLPQNIDLTLPQNALFLWQNYFFKTHLPVQVLNWVGDRMEMANVLEGRTPFLSKKMREFVYNLPDRALVSGFTDKLILRRGMEAIVPAHFARQPKKQFGAPFLDLDKLQKDFGAAEAFEAAGFDHKAIFDRITKRRNSILHEVEANKDSGHASARLGDLRFELSHLEQVRQTSATLGIVHTTLVCEKPLLRDEAYEEQILRSEKVYSTG